jgi:hypothetical protein
MQNIINGGVGEDIMQNIKVVSTFFIFFRKKNYLKFI